MSVHVHYFTKTALRHLRELIQTKRDSLSRQGSWIPSYSTDETSDQSTQYHEQSFFLRSMAIVVPSFAIKKYIQQWLVEEGMYLGIEVITLDELAREIINYSDDTMIRESPLFPFFLRQVCRNFRRNGIWIEVKDQDGNYKKVHHESVLLKHLLDENGAEVFEDALQSLQQSILELIEAKAGILLSDDILGESYWSEFYELLTKSVQNLEDISDKNNQQVQPQTQATIYNENPFLSNNQTQSSQQLSLFSLLSSSDTSKKQDQSHSINPSEDSKATSQSIKTDNVATDNSNTLIVRVLEIFAILRGILQQEYRFFDSDEQSGTKFPQSSKSASSNIPIREMILAQAAEYLAQQKSKIDMGTQDLVPMLPYSYLCVYGFTSASGLYSDLLEKIIHVLDVDVLLLKSTTPFSFSIDASNEIVNRLIHQQLMLSQNPKESLQQEVEEYVELCHIDFEKHKKLIRWHLQNNFLVTEPEVVKHWSNFIDASTKTIAKDSFHDNQSNIFVQKDKMPLYVEATKALGIQAEIRWVCNRILQLHQQGVPYENMAIVRRNKEGLLSILYEESQRLGIPFSFVGDVLENTSLSRRISLFMKLLRDRERISLDVFFAASDSFFHSISKSEWDSFIQELGITSLRQMSQISHISTMGSILQVKNAFVQFLTASEIEIQSAPSSPQENIVQDIPQKKVKLTLKDAVKLETKLENLLDGEIQRAYLGVESDVIYFPMLQKIQAFREKVLAESGTGFVTHTSILSHVVVDKESRVVSRVKKKFDSIDILEIEIRSQMILIALSKIKHKKMSMTEIKSITLLLMELLGWHMPNAFVDNERSLIQSVMERLSLESSHFLDEALRQKEDIADHELEYILKHKRIFYWRDWLQLLGEQLSSVRKRQFGDTALIQSRKNIRGNGGGVQVLDAQEGQGRFFQHVFFLQMNSRVFPQTQEEDPLFPDVLRRRINSILPDLALRSEGGLQERHLFHTLFTSAQFVYLSYLAVDENGKEQNMSPLISPFPIQFYTSPSLYSSKFTLKSDLASLQLQKLPLPPEEAVVQIALAGDLSSEGEISLFALAYQEVLKSSPFHNPHLYNHIHTNTPHILFGWNTFRDETNSSTQELFQDLDLQRRNQSITNALLESLAEHYPAPFAMEATQMGPFSGLVGQNVFHYTVDDLDDFIDKSDDTSVVVPDPNRLNFEQSVYITTVESMIRCPFRLFLEKKLYAKPSKSKREFLPQIAVFSTGQIVHNALEDVVYEQLKHDDLVAAISDGAKDIDIPSNKELLPIVHERTKQELSKQGTILAGFQALAAEGTQDYFDVFREHVSSYNTNKEEVLQNCLGAELEGGFCVEVPLAAFIPTVTKEASSNNTQNTNGSEIKLAADFLSDELRLDDRHNHPIFHVKFKADRIDYVPASNILHRIDENQSVYCATKCDRKKICWCAQSMKPQGDYIHFVDYKTGKPVSAEAKEIKRCTKFFESTASGSKLQSLAYAASGPYLRNAVQKSKRHLEKERLQKESISEPLISFQNSLEDRVSVPENFKTSGSLHYIKPDEIPQREFAATEDTLGVIRGEESQLDYLGKSVASALLGRSLGYFFPRLVKSKVSEPSKVQDFQDNSSCDYCDVRQACRIWDSAERKKLILSLEDRVKNKKAGHSEDDLTAMNNAVDGGTVSALPSRPNEKIKSQILKKLWYIGRK